MSPSRHAPPPLPAHDRSRSATQQRRAQTPPPLRSLHRKSKEEKRTHDVSPALAPRPAVVEEDRLWETNMEVVSVLMGMWVEARRVVAVEALAGVQGTGTAPTTALVSVRDVAEETEDEAVVRAQVTPTQTTQPRVASRQAAAARPARTAAAKRRRRGKVQDSFYNYSPENPPPKVKKAREAAAAARKAFGSAAAAAAEPSRTSVAPSPAAGPSMESGSSSVAGSSRRSSGAASAATDVTVPESMKGTRKRSAEVAEEKEAARKEEGTKEEGNRNTRYGRALKRPRRMEE